MFKYPKLAYYVFLALAVQALVSCSSKEEIDFFPQDVLDGMYAPFRSSSSIEQSSSSSEQGSSSSAEQSSSSGEQGGSSSSLPSCGKETYNPETEFCYNGYVIDKCNGKEYAPPNQQCSYGVIQEMCGGIWFNTNTHFCRGGSSITELCGGTSAYDNTQFCRDGIVYGRCGTQEYNAIEYICCGGQIYSSSIYFCHDNEPFSCNNKPYNPTTHSCHGGVTYSCNSKPYNPSTHFCLDGTETPLCGTEDYTSLQFCSGITVYDKCGGDKEYNPTTELCCGNGKYTLATQFCSGITVYDKCGGDKEYNPTTEQCCGNGKYTIATHFCHTDEVYGKCGGTTYTPGTEQCCGSNRYTVATQFCYNNSNVGDFCGDNPQKSYNPTLYECKQGSNGIYLKGGIEYWDENYDAVLIGTQTWMARNLNYNATGSKCGSILYFYGSNGTLSDENALACNTYGRLYNWATAMGESASSTTNPSKVQGVCPSGWHLPSNVEWNALMGFVNPSCSDDATCTGAGTKLKATSVWSSYAGIPSGTDDFGFSALPGGEGYSSGSFFDAGNYGNWWSASEYNSNNAYNRVMRYNNENAEYSNSTKNNLYSVRCVMD